MLTIVMTIAIPDSKRGLRFSSGKCGSKIPVTGFLSTVGASAANVGRGRSYGTNYTALGDGHSGSCYGIGVLVIFDDC
jgi:hypothetical protein